MQKHKRIIATMILSVCISLGSCLISFAGQWKQDENGWMYQKDDGTPIINDWFSDPSSENTYHFDTFGYMNKGLTYINDKWYYFYDDGSLRFNYYNPDDDLISDNDGRVIQLDTPGATVAVVSLTTNSKILIGLNIINCSNSPITLGPKCSISDPDYNASFFMYDTGTSSLLDQVVIAPKEEKTVSFISLDMNPLNIKSGVTTAEYSIFCNSTEYTFYMPIYYIDDNFSGTILHMD